MVDTAVPPLDGWIIAESRDRAPAFASQCMGEPGGCAHEQRATQPGAEADEAMMMEATTNTVPLVRKLAYVVTERNEKTYWTRVGVAFVNRDGSLTVRLDAMPVNGMLQIRDEDPMRRSVLSGGGQ